MGRTGSMLRLVACCSLPLCLLVSLSLDAGVSNTAWAHPSPNSVATGTVTCASLTAILTFTPPLIPATGTAKEKVTLAGMALGNCADSSGSLSAVSVETQLQTNSVLRNSCVSFVPSLKNEALVVTITWSGGVDPTTVIFKAGSLKLRGKATGFTAKRGQATGSFPMSSAKLTAIFGTSSAAAITRCIAGGGPTVSSLQIANGSVSA